MRHLLSDMRLLSGSSDYVRFIVLGRSRTGSNLLRSLLNAHSQIEAYGEIFRNRETMDWDHIGYLRSERMRRMLLSDPVAFIEQCVFRRYPKGIRAVGFKIFYYHARTGGWEAIWPYLSECRDILVMHMKRRNILETHLSRKRAEVTDSWVNTTGKREEIPAVTLDYAECLADFERTRAYEEEFDQRFSGHAKITVVYEDLAAEYSAEMRRVFDFLGLPYEAVEPDIFKQSHLSLAEAITNYQQLKRDFAGSPWAGFFQE